MQPLQNSIGDAYDRIVEDYDARWTRHVGGPQMRLTHGLRLESGLRCADLGCGTGVDTLEMARRVAPGEVVAIDRSEGMLRAARERAACAGFALTTRCQSAEAFIAAATTASFDVVTLRFCLGYLDWRGVLQKLPRLLRACGRIGIVTILADSAPQAQATYTQLADELGLPPVRLTAVETLSQIETALVGAGLQVDDAWLEAFRLSFGTGHELATWLRGSGIATSDAMASASERVLDGLWASFAERVESQRQGAIVPLDFRIAGLVASCKPGA